MKRCELIPLLGGALVVWPGVGWAQQTNRVRRIGVLTPGASSSVEQATRTNAFLHALAALGWSAGQNVRFDIRYAGGTLDLSRLAAEIVDEAPDVILAQNAAVAIALRKLTRSIPIVFVNVPDPIDEGLVSSLARPGGNVTGFTNYDFSMGTKWLELLKEMAQDITRVVVAFTPRIQGYRRLLNLIGASAKSAGVDAVDAALLTMNDLQQLTSLIRRQKTGLILLPNFFVSYNRATLVQLAAREKVPAIYPYADFPAAGGLMCYGASLVEMYRNAAAYVDRVLNGAHPQDLPVQNPTKYTLSINLKTAKALGLTVPQSLLIQADEVIR